MRVQSTIRRAPYTSRIRRARSFLTSIPGLISGLGLTLLIGSCEQYPTDLPGLEPPSITHFQVSPDSVDLTDDDVAVTIAVGARGTGGIDSIIVTLRGPGGVEPLSAMAHEPGSGDRVNGVWTSGFELPAGSRPGVWEVTTIDLYHGGDELLGFLAEDLREAGFNTSLLVTLEEGPPAIATLEIDPAITTLAGPGDSIQLHAIARSESGELIGDLVFEWSSGDTAVATIDGDGLVRARWYGSTEIQVEAGGLTGTTTVVVTSPPDVEIIEPEDGTEFSLGDSVTLSGTAATYFGTSIGDEPISLPDSSMVWDSDRDGMIGTGRHLILTDLSTGEHTISLTATDDQGLSAADSVQIRIGETGALDFIIIEPHQAGLAGVGDTVTFHARGYDRFEGEIEGLDFTWSVDDPDLVDLESDGPAALMTALATGVAIVEVSVGEISAAAQIVIGAPTVEITGGWPSGMEVSHQYGTEITFEGWAASQAGIRLRGPALVWSSSIDGEFGSGESISITTLSAGFQMVTLTATDEFGFTASDSIEFLVRPLDDDYIIVEPEAHLFHEIGDTIRLSARAIDRETEREIADAVFTWMSADSTVASVDREGLVTAHGWGETEIVVFTNTGHSSLWVRVVPRPGVDFILLDPWELHFEAPAQSEQVIARAYTRYEELIEGLAFEWSTTDPNVATVDQNGFVTATGYGEASIIVEVDGVSASLAVQVEVPTPQMVWQTMQSGGGTTCGVTTDGVAYCWGYNLNGKLGDGLTTANFVATPKRVADDHEFQAFALGDYHVIGLTTSGKLFAWGGNDYGQLGDGTNEVRRRPVPIASDLTFSQVSASGSYTLALTIDGVVYSWGQNDYGQLGDGTTIPRSLPAPIASDSSFTAISAGWSHALALTADGRAWGWGFNWTGQLGAGTAVGRENQLVPVPVAGGHTFSRVSAGTSHSLGLTSSGEVYGWGFNSHGQVGDGTNDTHNMPVLIDGLSNITSISAGQEHSAVVHASGAAYTWGEGNWGKLGDGSEGTNRNSPGPVSGGLDFISITSSGTTIMALTRDGMIYGWGLNSSGTIGDGTFERRLVPTEMIAPEE